jgi:hypothetical protein
VLVYTNDLIIIASIEAKPRRTEDIIPNNNAYTCGRDGDAAGYGWCGSLSWLNLPSSFFSLKITSRSSLRLHDTTNPHELLEYDRKKNGFEANFLGEHMATVGCSSHGREVLRSSPRLSIKFVP